MVLITYCSKYVQNFILFQVTRGQIVLSHASVLDCELFVTADDIATGHSRLNLAFVASLFNKYVSFRI